MAIYYIDPQNGKAGNSGLSEEAPLITNKGLDVKPGDTVLFKRGSFIRDLLWNVNGEEGSPILYGAYGEGPNPVFCGSVDVSGEEDWREEEPGIWRSVYPLTSEVCNFVFAGAQCGTLQWEKSDLIQPGDWWDSGWGEKVKKPEDHVVFLCCGENPAKYYKQIECVTTKWKQLAQSGHDMVIRDLTFINCTHGFAGEDPCRNVTISHCRFEFIGGCVWNKHRRIRYGNAVECWNGAENVVVDHCTFYEIYDSGVTHQGSAECRAADGFWIRDNVFIACGMAAYEQRDVLPKKGTFANNVCMNAGCGFSHVGVSLPRNSEIWPQPMGHHIFLWRIKKPTEESCFTIENNLFMDAPYGTAIYSIICKEAEDQLVINDNIYQMDKYALFNRLYAADYSDFTEYVSKTGKDAQSREVKGMEQCTEKKCSVDLGSVQDFCEYYHYPEDAVTEIVSVGRMIMDSPGAWEKFQKAYVILFDEENLGAEAYLSVLREVARELKLNDYIVPLVFYLCAVSDLEQLYAKKQMPAWVCQDSLRDLLYKVRECKTWTGCYGLYSPAWFYEYFRVERFGLGRLQYDVMPYYGKACRIADRDIQPGDYVLRCHIPRSEQSFGKEERMRSYKLAYRFAKRFYPEIFQEKTIPIMCVSWLLFPLNERILPETSNIVSFMKEFKLVEVLDRPDSTMERIFNKRYQGNPQDMPADSALQKGYRQWLIAGNVSGEGHGVMLFDGENVINN